jgi:hypothetical protein
MFSPGDRPRSMDGSASALPSYLFQPAILDYDWDRGVAVSEGKHFRAKLEVILRISIFEGLPLLCIVLTRLSAIRATWLRIYY